MYGEFPYREFGMPSTQDNAASVIRSLKEERIDMRLDAQRKHLIEQGAALRGMSVTDFVVQSAAQAAEQVIRDQQVISLTLAGQQAFVQALTDPPAPNDALRSAFKRYQERSGQL